MFLTSIMAGALALSLSSAPPSNAACLSCHGVPGLVKLRQGGVTTPLDVNPGLFARSVHGRRPCVSCHTDAVMIPHAPGLRSVGCKRCHGEERTVEGRFHEATTAWVEGEVYTMPILAGDQRNTCLSCHGSAAVHADTRALKMNIEELDASVHRRFACLDCHPNARTLPHRATETTPCARCHQDEHAKWTAGSHGTTDSGPTCVTCHGRHDVLPVADPRSRTHPLNVIKICAECHGSAMGGDTLGLNPVDAYKRSIHAEGIFKAGLVNSAVCNRCHGAHDVFPSSDPRSHVHKQNVAATCGQCHEGIRERYNKSIHGRLLAEGNPDAPACNDCHSSHEIAPQRGALDIRILRSGCGNCHETRKKTYDDTFHGKATSLGYLVAATCADCHTAHDILPASDTGSSVHPGNVLSTCRSCHPSADARITSFQAHADALSPEAPFVIRAVFYGMTSLLIGTLVFFGLHTFLWLQRSIVGWWRGDVHLEGLKWAAEPGIHIKRFTEVQRVTHLMVVVSFLGLAATGLPLHFHEHTWAQWTAVLLGGVEVTRFLHRACAVITAVYFLVHFASLAVRVFRDREIKILWGADSLVPRWHDAVNFWEHLKWCLYMGPPAKVDRWTYWEKFDYLAIFWGVPIIGLSGLVLWFPEWWSQWIPGIGFNLASIIHGDEALLATSFVFIVHFFHTHLRPEAFPIDVSIFTGTVPLERFKRERPAHYQRLVDSGKLEKMLVPPPPPEMAHAAMAFGFTALGVGLFLILSILITVIFL